MTRTAVLLISLASLALAQNKPTLKPADYGRWESLGAATLSPDGKWIAYEIRRTNGENELRVNTINDTNSKAIAFCTGAAFSADSHWLACLSGVSETEQDRARKASRPVHNKLKIVELANMSVTTIDDVPAFGFSGDGVYIAFPRYGGSAGGGRGGNGGNGGGGRGGRGGGNNADSAENSDPTGTTLTVRNLSTGVDTTFGNATSFSWQDHGTTLAMTIAVEGRAGNAIQVFDPQGGTLRVLDSGPALFTSLNWRKESNDLAAFRSVKHDGFDGES